MAALSIEQQAIDYLAAVYAAEDSFYEFAKQAWPIVSGNKPFYDGWYLQAICEHLEAVSKRQIKNLLVNMPPRHLKSTLISVMWPAWTWIHNPNEQFMCSSYSAAISNRDSRFCRRLIESKWYQERWGHIFSLDKDQNTKHRFDNSKQGYRIATSTGGSATGDGGSILLCVPYDTIINTNLGDLYIGEIVENEIKCDVLSFNHNTNKLEYKHILQYEKNKGKELIEIDYGDGSIYCTEEHPVYIEGKGYVQAKDIQVGDVVITL